MFEDNLSWRSTLNIHENVFIFLPRVKWNIVLLKVIYVRLNSARKLPPYGVPDRFLAADVLSDVIRSVVCEERRGFYSLPRLLFSKWSIFGRFKSICHFFCNRSFVWHWSIWTPAYVGLTFTCTPVLHWKFDLRCLIAHKEALVTTFRQKNIVSEVHVCIFQFTFWRDNSSCVENVCIEKIPFALKQTIFWWLSLFSGL